MVDPGWNVDISDAKEFNDLPSNARDYIKMIEDEIERSIINISVGPRADQTIQLIGD